MLKELHDLAGQHEVIAENIQGQLVQEAQKLVQDMKNERRKVGLSSEIGTILFGSCLKKETYGIN